MKITFELSFDFDIEPWLTYEASGVESKTVCRIPSVVYINENGVTCEATNALNEAIEEERKKRGLSKLKY